MAAGHSGCDATMNTINNCHAGLKRDWAFLSASALLFVASAVTTIFGNRSMSGGMAMPGDWTMSMAWMRMQDQNWLAAAFSFMGMWVVMMAAMMLPALVPALLRYRVSVRGLDTVHLNATTVLAGAGYFFVWILLGAVAYPIGVILTNAEMHWRTLARSVPLVTGAVLLVAGGLQLTAWKARQLCSCRDEANCVSMLSPDACTAWRHGLRLGMHCLLCCLGLMMALLVTGVMNLGAMVLITIAITVERLAPSPMLVVRTAGVVLIAAGVLVIVLSASHTWRL
jgi:predicted metal-binding membrane protein